MSEPSHKYTQIMELLSRDASYSLNRRVFIFAGDLAWQKECLNNILQGNKSDALWVSNEKIEGLITGVDFVETKKYHAWLGNEKKVVIFDLHNDFDLDSFAAISGIIVGGGLFILLMPDKNKWDEIYSSPFEQRFIKSIHTSSEIIVINKNDEFVRFQSDKTSPHSSRNCHSASVSLTDDQQKVVDAIKRQLLSDENNPVVLISDRGRGKSAAMGIAAVHVLTTEKVNIAITAPRMRATDIVFKHIAVGIPEADVSKGSIKLDDCHIQFYSPDYLMENDIEADILLIDEAAAIPVPLLTSFLNKFPQCVFATTVHGYEGTGRGFALRFNKILSEKYPEWVALNMEMPIRWPLNDPLEKWIFNLLSLDAEIAGIDLITSSNAENIEQCLLLKDNLAENTSLLNEVFALLVIAHYRTRPRDLKDLLDNNNISVYASLSNNHVVAVALVIQEGQFSDSLSTAVYRGERRPQGHLLAQALTYHCGVECAATLNYARVMRIAVHPDCQNKGIGSALLKFIISTEQDNGRDAIGTSFGMTKPLLNFWHKFKFDIVRIGFSREQTSGEHAAIMLLPLSIQGSNIGNEAQSRFKAQASYWFSDVLKDLPLDIKNCFEYEDTRQTELTSLEEKDLNSFTEYSRNYELCISSLNKFVMLHTNRIKQDNFPNVLKNVLEMKVFNNMSWKDLGNKMNLSGQNEARKLFHRAVCYLVN